MTETTILDASAVSEIEARAQQVKELAGVGQFGEDMLRLCATVKHLRELNKGLAKDSVRQTNETHKAADRWEAELQQTETCLKAITEDRNELQSQLEQLRAENERLLRGDFTDEELQGFCHNLSEQDRDAFFEGCTKYQERLFGTSAIAQLKENQ